MLGAGGDPAAVGAELRTAHAGVGVQLHRRDDSREIDYHCCVPVDHRSQPASVCTEARLVMLRARRGDERVRRPEPHLARWRIEVNLRHLKRTMGMDRLKCHSADGVKRELLMFALVYDETLYLKVDDENLADFISRSLPQFECQRQGKLVGLSYYRAPESVLEDRAQAAAWARRAWEAALRANADKLAKKRTPLSSGIRWYCSLYIVSPS